MQTFVSHAQCGEDLYLFNNFFSKKRNGIFLEIGGHDGVSCSNTKFFEDALGWSGVLIEPHPEEFKKMTESRPRCKNYNALVSDVNDELEYSYVIGDITAISGVTSTLPDANKKAWFENPEYADRFKIVKQKMQPVRLSEIVKHSGITHIDFFSLDVEGHEFHVLKSFNFSEVPVYLVLIEGNIPECNQLLIDNGFRFVSHISGSNIFVNDRNAVRLGYVRKTLGYGLIKSVPL